MCEFCGCGEPSYRSVVVVLPTVNDHEPDTPAPVVAGKPPEDGRGEAEEVSMTLLEEAKQAMEEISQEADFFAKARKKRRQISQGDSPFVGER